MNNFLDVLLAKEQELVGRISRLQASIASPDYHARRLKVKLDEVLPLVEKLPDDPEVIRTEMLSVMAQIPGLLVSTWGDAEEMRKHMNAELQSLQEVIQDYRSYLEIEAQEAARAELEAAEAKALKKAQRLAAKKLKEDIASGKVKEPTKTSARKRKPGTRPGPPIGRYRNTKSKIKSKVDSGEDSEG